MPSVMLREGIFWVGVIDWNLREFHGYSTLRGTTYNAYLVLDEKVVLFDTVKEEFWQQFLENVSEVVDPRRIDWIVVNHVEMDHSGALPKVIDLVKPEKVICSEKGKEALIRHFHREDWPYHVVKSGDELSFGKRRARFFETRMLHWPDSMLTYLVEDKILISQDAFGQHYATSRRFDDEVEEDLLMQEAAKYFANILMPYSSLVKRLIEQLEGLKLPIEMIAPDHGVIWRNPAKILGAYREWSQAKKVSKVLVIYDTMWHSTEKMALAIVEGVKERGVECKLINLRLNHRSEVLAELLNAKALAVGSPTLNNGILPTVADFLSYLKGLRPTNLIGTVFGSYGWSGESVDIIKHELESMKVQLVGEGIKVNFVPRKEDLERCKELGRQLASEVKALT